MVRFRRRPGSLRRGRAGSDGIREIEPISRKKGFPAGGVHCIENPTRSCVFNSAGSELNPSRTAPSPGYAVRVRAPELVGIGASVQEEGDKQSLNRGAHYLHKYYFGNYYFVKICHDFRGALRLFESVGYTELGGESDVRRSRAQTLFPVFAFPFSTHPLCFSLRSLRRRHFLRPPATESRIEQRAADAAAAKERANDALTVDNSAGSEFKILNLYATPPVVHAGEAVSCVTASPMRRP